MKSFTLIALAALAVASPAFAQEMASPILNRSTTCTGSSQTVFADLGPRGVRERWIHNPSATNSLAFNMFGGAAALNTAGSVTLAPGGIWSGRITNQVNVICTAGQGITAGER